MSLKKINSELTKVVSILFNNKQLLMLIFASTFFVGLAFAGTAPITGLQTQIQNVCGAIKSLVPIIAFIMLIMAGVIYAAGQVMGAETRARANVWSTAMLVGAIIGLLIVALAPTIIGIFSGTGTNTAVCN